MTLQVHVADAGWPELPLPMHAAPQGVTLETVASSRAAAGLLFPDYSLAGWEEIGYDPNPNPTTLTLTLRP